MYVVVTHKPVDMFRSTVRSFKLYTDGDIGHVTYLLVFVTESFATQTITVIMWCTSFEMNASRCPSSTRQLMSISLYIMRVENIRIEAPQHPRAIKTVNVINPIDLVPFAQTNHMDALCCCRQLQIPLGIMNNTE